MNALINTFPQQEGANCKYQQRDASEAFQRKLPVHSYVQRGSQRTDRRVKDHGVRKQPGRIAAQEQRVPRGFHQNEGSKYREQKEGGEHGHTPLLVKWKNRLNLHVKTNVNANLLPGLRCRNRLYGQHSMVER